MKKLLFCLSFSLCLNVSLAQKQGFFIVYEQSEKSFCASAAIETEDDCMIIAVYDYYGGAGELKKISNNGDVLGRLPIGSEGVFSGIDGLYHDPFDSRSFYAIGHVTHWDRQITKPLVMHFSEDLDLLDWEEVDLPGEYRQFSMSRSMLTSEGDFLYATSLGPQDGYHRLYMRIALDGTLLKFYEETDGCGNSIMINAVFEFPEGNRFGDYRNSYLEQGSLTNVQRLFSFDDDFVFDTIHEYGPIQQTIGNIGYGVTHNSVANATAMPLNDSVLLFSDRAFEWWYDLQTNETIATDNSTILFSTDLDGNIMDFIVVGSRNDSTEAPVLFNAIDIAKGESINGKQVYHGCFGYNHGIPDTSPYNITVTKTGEHIDVVWQKSFTHHTRFLQATCLLATNDGGCLVVGGAFDYSNNRHDWFALKINPDGFLDTDEILIQDNRPYAYYPNPAQDELHLHYSPDVTPTQIELYDLQGRLVKTQRSSLESLNLQGLAAGTYTMRVTLEGGKVFSDKVVKE